MERAEIALQIIKTMPALVERIYSLQSELRTDLSANAKLCAYEAVTNANILGREMASGCKPWAGDLLIRNIAATSLMSLSAIEKHKKDRQVSDQYSWAAVQFDGTGAIVSFEPFRSFENALCQVSYIGDEASRLRCQDDDGEYWTTIADGFVIEILETRGILDFFHALPDISYVLAARIEEELSQCYPIAEQIEHCFAVYGSSNDRPIPASLEDILGDMVLIVMQMAMPRPIYKLGRKFKASNIGCRRIYLDERRLMQYRNEYFCIDTGDSIDQIANQNRQEIESDS